MKNKINYDNDKTNCFVCMRTKVSQDHFAVKNKEKS